MGRDVRNIPCVHLYGPHFDLIVRVCASARNDGERREYVEIGCFRDPSILNPTSKVILMNNIVYIVGAVVIVLVILSFLGLR